MKLSALPYYGGKAISSNQGTGRWIASLLPSRTDVLYCEPFAGMLGVLLQRPQSKVELVNDLDKRIITWWMEVRDNPREFAYRVSHTPKSRVEFDRCVAMLDDSDAAPMEMALAVHVVLSQSLMAGLGKPHWAVGYSTAMGTRRPMAEERIQALSERLINVQLEARDALEILERTSTVTDAVIYVDPPYSLADTSLYGQRQVELDALTASLLAQKGQVAISGYGDEWDHLDWTRHARGVQRHTLVAGKGVNVDDRREILWTNYASNQSRMF